MAVRRIVDYHTTCDDSGTLHEIHSVSIQIEENVCIRTVTRRCVQRLFCAE